MALRFFFQLQTMFLSPSRAPRFGRNDGTTIVGGGIQLQEAEVIVGSFAQQSIPFDQLAFDPDE